MKVLTEADLRAARISRADGKYRVAKDTFVTPAAREYLRDRGVRLVMEEDGVPDAGISGAEQRAVAAPDGAVRDGYAPMTRTPVKRNGERTFVNAETGEGYSEKPEEMTHLRGNLLVPKTHPRIALRGELDGMQARVLLLQVRFSENRLLCQDLESVLSFLRAILGAEVKGEKLPETPLFGLSHRELRRMSHQVKETFGIDHPIPDCTMGEAALELNLLRTQVRLAELAAARAFPDGDCLGLIEHLNRLSSGIYILFCRMVSGYYERMEGERHG